jgi:predicted phage-related endonuclease
MTAINRVERIPITSREQWLGLRRMDVTASDVPSICGVGYRTALAVWAEKTGRVPPRPDSPVLRKGRWFEPAIFEAMAELYPEIELRRAKIYLRSDEHRLGATPDVVAIEHDKPGILVAQGKVVSRPIFERDWLEDPENPSTSPVVVPVMHRLQTVTEAMLAEAAFGQETRAAVAALVHDVFTADFYLIPVYWDEDTERHILTCTAAFWSDIDAGRQPQVDAKRDGDTIKALYPKDNGTTIDLTGDNELPGLFDERASLGKRMKADDTRRDEIRTIFADRMGDATFADLADGRKVSLQMTHNKGYTVDPFDYRALRIVGKRK